MKYQNMTTFDLDPLLGFLTDKFVWDGTVVVCQNDKLLDRLGTPDIRLESMLVDGPLADTFTIYVRGGKPSDRVICHEFIHLMQMLRGDLKVNTKDRWFEWKGERYDASFPYNERPWEREAFARQGFWLREYRKSIKH